MKSKPQFFGACHRLRRRRGLQGFAVLRAEAVFIRGALLHFYLDFMPLLRPKIQNTHRPQHRCPSGPSRGKLDLVDIYLIKKY